MGEGDEEKEVEGTCKAATNCSRSRLLFKAEREREKETEKLLIFFFFCNLGKKIFN